MKRAMFIVTAPSGAGKSTLIQRLHEENDCIDFSRSATTRAPRSGEVDGQEYIFLTEKEFRNAIREDKFVEYEEVYPGKYYGTLLWEIERINDAGKVPVLDLDVKGAWNIKQKFPEQTRVVFIQPPSREVLEQRLRARNTESESDIRERLDRAAYELGFADRFDHRIVNDNLETSSEELGRIFQQYAQQNGLCQGI